MSFRIYIDESGTQSEEWFVIGMLFVPQHGPLHAELCRAKEDESYFNTSPKRNARYRELHFAGVRSRKDAAVCKRWIDLFIKHPCYYRSIVVDWSIWQPGYFGDAFDQEALQKRRAYKKWAEMLLHPELKAPCFGQPIYHAKLYLDKLRIMYGYDVLPHLQDRFTANYQGESPYIDEFQHTDSWKDANQCLQLCDLLTGCLYQSLVPSTNEQKLQVRDHLAAHLKRYGVARLEPSFWKQYGHTLTKHFPKFSAWFWRPQSRKERTRKKKRKGY